jgi:hypothetical protein
LLAHEVAHTVQQSHSSPATQLKPEVSSPGDAAEQEADKAAGAMVDGRATTIQTVATGVHRNIEDKKLNVPLGHFEIQMIKVEDPLGQYKSGEVGEVKFYPNDTNLKPAPSVQRLRRGNSLTESLRTRSTQLPEQLQGEADDIGLDMRPVIPDLLSPPDAIGVGGSCSSSDCVFVRLRRIQVSVGRHHAMPRGLPAVDPG